MISFYYSNFINYIITSSSNFNTSFFDQIEEMVILFYTNTYFDFLLIQKFIF